MYQMMPNKFVRAVDAQILGNRVKCMCMLLLILIQTCIDQIYLIRSASDLQSDQKCTHYLNPSNPTSCVRQKHTHITSYYCAAHETATCGNIVQSFCSGRRRNLPARPVLHNVRHVERFCPCRQIRHV